MQTILKSVFFFSLKKQSRCKFHKYSHLLIPSVPTHLVIFTRHVLQGDSVEYCAWKCIGLKVCISSICFQRARWKKTFGHV